MWLGYGSVVEDLPNMGKALGSNPSTGRKRRKRKESGGKKIVKLCLAGQQVFSAGNTLATQAWKPEFNPQTHVEVQGELPP